MFGGVRVYSLRHFLSMARALISKPPPKQHPVNRRQEDMGRMLKGPTCLTFARRGGFERREPFDMLQKLISTQAFDGKLRGNQPFEGPLILGTHLGVSKKGTPT